MRQLVLALCVLCLTAPVAAAAPELPLGHSGRWVTDAQGRVVVLHGYNMVYKRAPYAPDAIGIGEDDAAFLEAEGYNTARVGVIYAAVEPSPGVYDDAYLARIADTVATLGRHGIYSLLDFHQDMYNERFQGEGFPDWAVQDDGLPAEPQLGFPGNYLAQPAVNRAFDHWWNNDGSLQVSYANAWRHVAERFRDDPDVLGYDIFNEPWPGTGWQACGNPEGCPAFDAKLAEFTKRVLTAIRSVDPATLVYYEPNVIFNNGAATNIGDPGDGASGFSFHDYCLQHDSTGSASGCDTFDDLVFTNAEAQVQSTGDTPLLTEFGATADPAVLGPMTARADATMIGWEEWHYCACDDPTTSGPGDEQAVVRDPRKPPEGDNLDTGKLALLTRPYPQVVAGTPVSWAFDPQSKVFEARWVVKRADGKGSFGADADSEIAVPARQYPSGYAVSVKGGRIVATGPVLRVRACPGAGEVAVALKPGDGRSDSCAAPAVPRLSVSVAPRRVRVGQRVRLTVRARVHEAGALRPVFRAAVRVGGKARGRTDAGGRLAVRVRFKRPGRYVVRVSARGFRAGKAVVVARR